MDTPKPVNWKVLAQIVLSVITFGWGWLSGNQSIVIGFVASLLTWLFSFLLFKNIDLGKFWRTVIVFVFAVILQLIFAFPTVPAFPGWDIPALVIYLGQWMDVIKDVVLAAMTVYNLLLDQILVRVLTGLRRAFPALRAKKG